MIANAIIFIVLTLCLIILILAWLKADNAMDMQIYIASGIHHYILAGGTGVTYADMESYFKTVYRFWDWGYTRILPPDKFEKIQPYLNSGR